jgi:hypothetical protein
VRVDGLTPQTTYYYMVTSTGADGASDGWKAPSTSSRAMARTPVPPQPIAVGAVSARIAGSGREQRTRSFDPKETFRGEAINGRNAP